MIGDPRLITVPQLVVALAAIAGTTLAVALGDMSSDAYVGVIAAALGYAFGRVR